MLNLARQSPGLAAIKHLAKLPEHGSLELDWMQAALMTTKQFMARPTKQSLGLAIDIEDFAAIAIGQETSITILARIL